MRCCMILRLAIQPVPAINNSLVADGVDVSALTDEELFEKLLAFGVPVGPIVGELSNCSFRLNADCFGLRIN